LLSLHDFRNFCFWSYYRRSDVVYSPFLVDSVVFLPNEDWLVLFVATALDVKDESSNVDDLFALQLELFMPDTLRVTEFNVSLMTPVSDVEGKVLSLDWLDGSGLGIKYEDLLFSVVLISNHDVVVTDSGDNTARLHL